MYIMMDIYVHMYNVGFKPTDQIWSRFIHLQTAHGFLR